MRRILAPRRWLFQRSCGHRIDAGVAERAVRSDALVAQNTLKRKTRPFSDGTAWHVFGIRQALNASHSELRKREPSHAANSLSDQAAPEVLATPPIADLALRHRPVDAVNSDRANENVCAFQEHEHWKIRARQKCTVPGTAENFRIVRRWIVKRPGQGSRPCAKFRQGLAYRLANGRAVTRLCRTHE